MIRMITVFIGICFILGPSIVRSADAEKEATAIVAAETWLALVDEGSYGESWNKAAAYFKNAISEEQWSKAVQAARNPLGKLVFRTVKSSTYSTSLPGAPDGEYVVIQFDTSFENKKSAVETVTPMLGKDSEWRVSGYYVQ